MDSKLRDDKKPKGEKAEDKEENGLKEEREKLAFHGLTGFDVEWSVAKKTVNGLSNRFFLGIRAELPVNVDDTSLRQVFEWRDDSVPELTGRGAFNLKCFHAFDSKFTVGRQSR